MNSVSTRSNGADRLAQAREAYARKDWSDASQLFRSADAATPLDVPDLERLAWSEALCGHDRDMIAVFERLHQQLAQDGRPAEAAYAAFWAGFRLFALGEAGRATAWLQRAQRCIDESGADCVTRGYLLLPAIHRQYRASAFDGALSDCAAAIDIGKTFGDENLVAFARTMKGMILIQREDFARGMALLDEAMLSATGGDLSPVITGLVYCTVIATCCRVQAMDRAREWTAALRKWCDAQPQLIPFSGVCMVHRAEIMQLNGAWTEAMREARNAYRNLDGTPERDAAAAALYQEGEIHRLRGSLADAERCYGGASRLGRDPQPGLALLRLAQGRNDQAKAAINRALGTSSKPLDRAQLLPAFVEIMLAAGDIAKAETACGELERIAHAYGTEILGAMAAHARGALDLSTGNPSRAVGPLRAAFSAWQKANAPYLAARVRTRIAEACLALGDREGAALELSAARAIFEEVGAGPDLAQTDRMMPASRARSANGLTRREREVLRLLADGKTNRAIAGELGLSSKTVDRHVGNIFNKLGVSSRAAATASAYKQDLL